MNQKGVTYIEMLISLAIISIGTLSIKGYRMRIEKIQFNDTVSILEQSIKTAQQLAYYEHGTYRIYYENGYIYIRDTQRSKYKVAIPKDIKVEIGNLEGTNTKQKELVFSECLAPSQSGTITLKSDTIRKKAQITLRPATGKTAVYMTEY